MPRRHKIPATLKGEKKKVLKIARLGYGKVHKEILSWLEYNAEFVKLQLFFQFHRCYHDNTLNWDWYTANYMTKFFRGSVQEGITNKYTHGDCYHSQTLNSLKFSWR